MAVSCGVEETKAAPTLRARPVGRRDTVEEATAPQSQTREGTPSTFDITVGVIVASRCNENVEHGALSAVSFTARVQRGSS
jgi:hypothetical protein